MRSLFRIAFIVVVAAGMGSALAAPPTLDRPTKEPILEITGQIEAKNAPEGAVFDREMLESIGMKTITTTTPWHSGQVRFEGVPMDKLMERVGARGKAVRAVALNDYASTVPMDDFARHGVILAMKRDGQYMPIKDKGPLFIIYPYDSSAELKSQMYYARSVWQVKRLEVLP
jgi:hypothetical protein